VYIIKAAATEDTMQASYTLLLWRQPPPIEVRAPAALRCSSDSSQRHASPSR
jgi:hypothetical protein